MLSKMHINPRGPNLLQKISMSLMAMLVLLTFVGANLHALLWQSSEWLISTVLPAVVVDLTNQQRASNAAVPLQRNALLDEAARLKAEHMAKHQYFAHHSPDGVSPWYWFERAGYVYAHAGENLAIHFTDSSQVVDAWMKSPTHRQNIVNNLYTEIGVGTAKGQYDGYDTVYVVQLFGAPGVTVAPVSVPLVPVAGQERVSPEVEIVIDTEDLNGSVDEQIATEPVIEVPVTMPELSEIETEIVLLEPATEVLSDFESNVAASETIADSEVEPETYVTKEIVSIEIPMIATSSGLMVARITTPYEPHAGATLASIATQPNALLQILYVTLGAIVLFLLTISIVIEARRFRFIQVAYGVALIVGMGGLWFTHSLLTSGAVIV